MRHKYINLKIKRKKIINNKKYYYINFYFNIFNNY